jgi:hypothetical protein
VNSAENSLLYLERRNLTSKTLARQYGQTRINEPRSIHQCSVRNKLSLPIQMHLQLSSSCIIHKISYNRILMMDSSLLIKPVPETTITGVMEVRVALANYPDQHNHSLVVSTIFHL